MAGLTPDNDARVAIQLDCRRCGHQVTLDSGEPRLREVVQIFREEHAGHQPLIQWNPR
jgi:hypothetical protein